MDKVDRERADVLRAELARLCWLTAHDQAGGSEAARLLQQRLVSARTMGTPITASMGCLSITERPE